MKKILFCLMWLVGATVAFAASPQELINRAAEKLKASSVIQVTYTLKADGQTTDGLLTIAGDRFTVSSPGLSSWYDGSTQWTYSKQMGEVNIITPTPEEVEQINPFAIIRSLGRNYKATAMEAPKGSQGVRLTSTRPSSDIRQVDITFSDATSWPTHLVITLSNKQTIDVTVQKVAPGNPLPTSFFKFDRKKYPGVQVVDLR